MMGRGEARALENRCEADLLKWLTQCAATGAACPTNDEICARFGFSSKASSVRLLGRLEERGLITRERVGNNRRVMIKDTGAVTAMGGQGFGAGGCIGTGRNSHRRFASDAAIAEAFPAVHPVPEMATDRTPCPRCGIRADIGCRHRPKAVDGARG